MRSALLAIILFCVAYNASASNTDSLPNGPDRRGSQLFINTTFFLKQVINLSSSNLAISPYIVGYKYFPGAHNGFRNSIGGNFSSVKDGGVNSGFSRTTGTATFDARVGYEYRYSFGKFWTFFTGLDFVTNLQHTKSVVNSSGDFTTTTDDQWSLGTGPIVGIQINIHKNISLFTETAFYVTGGQTKERVTSSSFPGVDDSKVTGSNITGQFLLPTSIYFVFRF